MTLEATVESFRIGLTSPVHTARGVVLERSGWVLVLRDGDRWGRGEVAPLPGWATSDERTAEGQLRTFVQRTLRDGRPAPVTELAPEVRAGIDTAQRSLAAAIAGLPLWRELGGMSGEVRVNHLVVGSSPASLAAHARDEVRRGATVLKVKLGLRDDSERLEALAGVVPATVAVRFDANAVWSVEEAVGRVELIDSLFGSRVEYFEDPVATLDALGELRRRVDVALAVDELVRRPRDLDRVIDEELADVVVVKPPMVGGLGATLQLADQARSRGLDVVVSSLYDGPVGLAAWCHLAAALGGSRAHGLGTAALLAGGVAGHLQPVGDRIVLPG